MNYQLDDIEGQCEIIRMLMSKAEYRIWFAGRVKDERIAAGYTPEQMADFLGLKIDTYKKHELRTPLPGNLIPRFCAVCKISVDKLYSVEEGRRAVKPSPFVRHQKPKSAS